MCQVDLGHPTTTQELDCAVAGVDDLEHGDIVVFPTSNIQSSRSARSSFGWRDALLPYWIRFE